MKVEKNRSKSECRCCCGQGIQERNDGIFVQCPCCGGTGNWETITTIELIEEYEFPRMDPKKILTPGEQSK